MKKKNGFTLVEVLGVIVILGIIAGVAIPMVFQYVKKSRNQAYQVMQTTIYDGARNYVLDENRYLMSCDKGFEDVEQSEQRLLEKLQYVEKLTDPVDKSKQCFYKVYGCMESEPSMEKLATYKYKVQIECIDYRNCAVYRDDGTILPCDDTTEQTEGPKCGTYTSTNNDWKNIESVDISLTCEDNTTGKCDQRTYNQTFTEETKTTNITIKDIFGNTTTCPVDVYIDRTAPSKPTIENPYENKWTNKSYSIKIKSVDNVSGIKYFEYRYPNSSNAEEREWKQWANSSKKPGDNTPFTTTNFSLERDENVEVRACDYAGNCSESTQSMIKIDKSKPTCSITKNPASPNGSNGWYISNVSLTLNTNDTGGSGVNAKDMTTSTTVTYNGKTNATQASTTGITYYGYVKDAAGNTGTCNSGSFKVDSGALGTPTITNSNSSKWVNYNYDISISIKATSSGLAYIQYSTDNTNWSTISGSSAGANATKTVKLNLDKEGTYTYYIRACNNVGKCSASAQTKSYIDKTNPTCSITKNPASPNGSNGWYKSNVSLTLNTNDTGGSGVSRKDMTTSTTATYNGKTTATQGNTTGITYYGYVKDVAGNTGTCNSGLLKVNTATPTKPTITNPYENTWINKSYAIKVSSVDNTSGIAYFEYRYPNSSVASEKNWVKYENSDKPAGNSSAFTTTNFSKERNETVEIRACNYAGVCSEPAQSIIKIDKSKPTCSITKNPASSNGSNGWYISNVSLTLNTSDTGGSGVSGKDMTTSTTVTYNGKTTATQGSTTGITYYGYVKDAAGNTGTCNSGSFKVDSGSPSTPTITNSNSSKWVNYNYDISISTKVGASGLAYIQYSTDNTNWSTISESSAGANANKTVKLNLNKEGAYTYYVRTCNNVGKCSASAQTKSYIDKTKPTCSITKNPASPNGSNGWYKSNVSLTLNTNDTGGSGVSAKDMTTSSTATYNGKTTATQGNTAGVTYYGYVKDNAGNIGTCNSGSFKVDTTAPTCSIQLTGTGGTDGVYTSNVSLKLNAADEGSVKSEVAAYGLANNSTVAYNNINTGTQGATNGITWYGFVKDNAGNTSTCNTGNFKVLLKPPVITFSLADNISTATCTDGNTGAYITAENKTLTTSDLTHSMTCTNAAGQSTTESYTYKTEYTCTKNCHVCNTCHGVVYEQCNCYKSCAKYGAGHNCIQYKDNCSQCPKTTTYDCNCRDECCGGYNTFIK